MILNYGFAHYKALINGILIENAVFKPKHQFIRKVLFSTVNEKSLEIKFYLLGVSSKEHINSVLKSEVEFLLDRFSFEFDMYIGEALQKEVKFFKSNSGSVYRDGTSTSCCDGKVKIIRSIEKKAVKNSAILQRCANTSLNIFLSQYRFALAQSDLVSTFMLLYNILLSLNNDNQVNLDRYVVKVEKATLQSLSPHTGGQETIYTKLRNEIAHNRGEPPAETVKNIRENVAPFRKIVKKAISNVKKG